MSKKTTDAIKIIDKMIGEDEELREMCEQATVNAHVAQLIYDARTEAGLSQKELAEMIATTQSVISRLEDADYEGHSLSMLSRIAQALNHEVKIDLIPALPALKNAPLSHPNL
jgi:ribosome-binding protein aMBF1 (putative translation factor)